MSIQGILVERYGPPLDPCGYIVLNQVCVKSVTPPRQWTSNRYRTTSGKIESSGVVDAKWSREQFGE